MLRLIDVVQNIGFGFYEKFNSPEVIFGPYERSIISQQTIVRLGVQQAVLPS
jgi:hypothetical protein